MPLSVLDDELISLDRTNNNSKFEASFKMKSGPQTRLTTRRFIHEKKLSMMTKKSIDLQEQKRPQEKRGYL